MYRAISNPIYYLREAMINRGLESVRNLKKKNIVIGRTHCVSGFMSLTKRFWLPPFKNYHTLLPKR